MTAAAARRAHSLTRHVALASTLLCVALAAGLPWLMTPRGQAVVAIALACTGLVWLGLAIYLRPGSRADPRRAALAALDAGDKLQREVQELREMQHELVEAKLAAEAATMAKGEFLATMSHEIRTPLNGILPLLDVVMSTPLRDDQRDYINTAHVSAQELLRIVDDILDYSKIEAGRLDLETIGINLRDLIEGVTSLLQRNASYKNLYLRSNIDRSVRLAVRGDPVRLRQVLTNLVSNAIKFTERGGVLIDVSRLGETHSHHRLAFTVRDTGIGIGPQAREKIFEPFSQADSSTTRAYGGTGLGLVICKRLVDLMGGSIEVESTLGEGSSFRVVVPLLKAPGDIRAQRDPSAIRTLALLSQPALIRQTTSALSQLGMHVSHSRIPADALTTLRDAHASGGKRVYELLIVDADGFRTAIAALLRNVDNDPVLAGLRVLFIGDKAKPENDAANVRHLRPPVDADTLRIVLADWFDDATDSAPPDLLDLPGAVQMERVAPPPAEYAAQPTVARDVLSATQPSAIGASKPTPTMMSGHVLVVEDNPVNAAVARRLLDLVGLRVSTVHDGRQALDAIAREPFDLVLMDCQMPVMDGYSATREQREREQASGGRIPIIAMTANAMAGDREKCLAAGMDDYLSKPLQRDVLANTLQRWLTAIEKPDVTAEIPAEHIADPMPARATPATPTPAADPMAAAQSPPPAQQPAASATLEARQEPALDNGVFNVLVDLMADNLQEFIMLYLGDAPRHIMRLQTAIAAQDMDGAVSAAHLLKSSSANLGAMTLSAMVRRIEEDGRRGTLEFESAKASAVAREFIRVATELRQRSEKLQKAEG